MKKENSLKATHVIGVIFTVLVAVIMIIYCISLLFPLVWLIINSFKGYMEYYTVSSFAFPQQLNFENYANVFDKLIYTVIKDGGRLKEISDCAIIVPENETFKIQELHLPVYHALCLMLEETFF